MSRNLTRLRRYAISSMLFVTSLFGLMAVQMLVDAHASGPPAVTLGVLGTLGAAATVYLHALPFGVTRRWDRIVLALGSVATIVVVGVDAATHAPSRGSILLVGLFASGLIMRTRESLRGRAVLAVTAVTAALVTASIAFIGVTELLFAPLVAVLISAIAWANWWTYSVALRLDQARMTEAELAVTQERLRFAAELHDIQGHHLQVIALKGELAARLAGRDPEAAAEQMREVEGLAKEALTDTRAVVGGYRDVRLGAEIANAVRVLTAAGIPARHNLDVEHIEIPDRASERLLGLVVREATTNMIRHAQPRKASIHLVAGDDVYRLTVRNDGAPEDRGPGDGTGLRGLAERFDEAGGTVRWMREGNEFTVTAELA